MSAPATPLTAAALAARRAAFDPSHDDALTHFPTATPAPATNAPPSPPSSNDLDLPFQFTGLSTSLTTASRPSTPPPPSPPPELSPGAAKTDTTPPPAAPDPPLHNPQAFLSTSTLTATPSNPSASPRRRAHHPRAVSHSLPQQHTFKRASLPTAPTPTSPSPRRARADSSATSTAYDEHGAYPDFEMLHPNGLPSFASSAPAARSPGSSVGSMSAAMLMGRAQSKSSSAVPPGATGYPRGGGSGEINWSAAKNAQLLTPSAGRARFDVLVSGLSRHVVFVFATQKNVEVSALVYSRVAHLLQQQGAKLVFLTPWTPPQAAAFLARFERVSPFPGTLLCDPDATLYSAVNFKRGTLASWLPSAHKPLRHGVRAAAATAQYRAANRDLARTATSAARIKSGAVVIRNGRGAEAPPKCVLRVEEGEAGSGPGCYLDVLPVCGVNGAFIPDLDIPHVISRFQNMRNNAIKAAAEEERAHARMGVGSSERKRNGLK